MFCWQNGSLFVKMWCKLICSLTTTIFQRRQICIGRRSRTQQAFLFIQQLACRVRIIGSDQNRHRSLLSKSTPQHIDFLVFYQGRWGTRTQEQQQKTTTLKHIKLSIIMTTSYNGRRRFVWPLAYIPPLIVCWTDEWLLTSMGLVGFPTPTLGAHLLAKSTRYCREQSFETDCIADLDLSAAYHYHYGCYYSRRS